MKFQSILLRAALLAVVAPMLSGCLAMAAAGAAGTVVGTAVGLTAKAVVLTAKGAGAVAGAVIPGGKKKDDSSGS